MPIPIRPDTLPSMLRDIQRRITALENIPGPGLDGNAMSNTVVTRIIFKDSGGVLWQMYVGTTGAVGVIHYP